MSHDGTLRAGRAAYFERWGFGDGGYGDRWVKLKIGPIPVFIPNLPSRVRAVKLHDLHHVLTGYDADWRGEFEISSWELGAGCGNYGFAWAINLQGLLGGVLLAPGRCLRAFARGRRGRSLYRVVREFSDDLLDETIEAHKAKLGIVDDVTPTARDVIGFLAMVSLAGIVNLGPLVAAVAAAVYLW